jgi:peroxiredoxin Q/BCP
VVPELLTIIAGLAASTLPGLAADSGMPMDMQMPMPAATPAAAPKHLAVGDPAPLVNGLVTDADTTINLADFYKKQAYTIVYFYPKAGTPGCTAQGCSLRDGFDALVKQGVAILGVSTDTVEAQKKFKDENHFPFTLISDTDKKVIKAFGQPGLGAVASREAFLIKDGKVVYHDTGVTTKQAQNILDFLAKTSGATATTPAAAAKPNAPAP